MIKKNCHYCGKDSYSSYNDPDWRCPYCGEKLPYIQQYEDDDKNKADLPAKKRFAVIQNIHQ